MSDSNGQIGFELYRYTPNIAAAVIFIILFTLSTAYHSYQLIKCRAWYFIAFVIGGICERRAFSITSMAQELMAFVLFTTVQVIGYAARVAANSNKENVPIYSIQTILILLAPPLYAASIYIVLGRIVTYLHAEHFSLVSVKWMTGIFVTGDVIAFLMQAAGGGIMASGTISAMNTGKNITIGGLCVQLVFFSFFVITSLVFHFRIRRQPTGKVLQLVQHEDSSASGFRTWESVLWGLYIASVLILIRSIFRLIEYAQGNDGYLISHEAFMYVFDTMLMFFAMVAMNVFHPSVILNGNRRVSRGSMWSNSQTELRCRRS